MMCAGSMGNEWGNEWGALYGMYLMEVASRDAECSRRDNIPWTR